MNRTDVVKWVASYERLWRTPGTELLGHEQVQTTTIYLHADLTIKERALARLASPTTPQGRYRPPDSLLAFLDAL